MKKFIFSFCFGLLSLAASASSHVNGVDQEPEKSVEKKDRGKMAEARVGLSWGVNFAKMSLKGGTSDSEAKFLNFGLEGISPVFKSGLDFSYGVEWQTKGHKGWDPGILQFPISIGYNVYCNDNVRLTVVTGPQMGALAAGDDVDSDALKTFQASWFFGGRILIKNLYLKVGYDLGLTDAMKGVKSKMNTVALRVGYAF